MLGGWECSTTLDNAWQRSTKLDNVRTKRQHTSRSHSRLSARSICEAAVRDTGRRRATISRGGSIWTQIGLNITTGNDLRVCCVLYYPTKIWYPTHYDLRLWYPASLPLKSCCNISIYPWWILVTFLERGIEGAFTLRCTQLSTWQRRLALLLRSTRCV
jgi:hypothetical protein